MIWPIMRWSVGAVAIIVASAVTALLVAIRVILAEVIRIYRTHTSSPVVWYALAGLLLAIAISVLLAALEQTRPYALWVLVGSVLLFIIILELTALLRGEGEDIEDVLRPWRFDR